MASRGAPLVNPQEISFTITIKAPRSAAEMGRPDKEQPCRWCHSSTGTGLAQNFTRQQRLRKKALAQRNGFMYTSKHVRGFAIFFVSVAMLTLLVFTVVRLQKWCFHSPVIHRELTAVNSSALGRTQPRRLAAGPSASGGHTGSGNVDETCARFFSDYGEQYWERGARFRSRAHKDRRLQHNAHVSSPGQETQEYDPQPTNEETATSLAGGGRLPLQARLPPSNTPPPPYSPDEPLEQSGLSSSETRSPGLPSVPGILVPPPYNRHPQQEDVVLLLEPPPEYTSPLVPNPYEGSALDYYEHAPSHHLQLKALCFVVAIGLGILCLAMEVGFTLMTGVSMYLARG